MSPHTRGWSGKEEQERGKEAVHQQNVEQTMQHPNLAYLSVMLSLQSCPQASSKNNWDTN